MSNWRRLRRGLVIAIAGGLVLYLALLVYGRVRLRRAEAAFLKTFGTLDLASFERPDPPREENAAEWLQAGAQAVFLDARATTLLSQAAGRTQPDWSDTERKTLTRILDDNCCALELLHRAAYAPGCSQRQALGEREHVGTDAGRLGERRPEIESNAHQGSLRAMRRLRPPLWRTPSCAG
jgi:hypothetical protein